MKRRNFMKSSTAATLAFAVPAFSQFSTLAPETRFGVADASYMMRRFQKMDSKVYPPFTNALEMIEHCGSIGFGGVQTGVSGWDSDFSKKVRQKAEEMDIFVEGQIGLPKTDTDIQRFESEVGTAKSAGVDVFRTACLSGRRYENFDTMVSFRQFREAAIRSLQLAEPIMRKHKVKLAVENHKDWRIEEIIEILGTINSDWVGVTLDTGNNISLLEDPMEVVEALAPYAFSVHLKDMDVAEYEDGFLLSEVNLGDGYLDIERMITTIRKHNPDIRFNLEMITRDPLKIPCLTEKYWATFSEITAPELAGYLLGIKKQKTGTTFPIISNRAIDEQLGMEEENNRICLSYSKIRLGFK